MLEAIQIERSPTVSRIIKLWAKGIKLTSTILCFHADYFKRNVCFAELCIESWHFKPSLSLFALKCMKWLHWRLLFPMSNCSCITHNVILPIPKYNSPLNFSLSGWRTDFSGPFRNIKVDQKLHVLVWNLYQAALQELRSYISTCKLGCSLPEK